MWNRPAKDDPLDGEALADGAAEVPDAGGEAARDGEGDGDGVPIVIDGCGAGVSAAPGSRCGSTT